jgi:hypothetical protein
MTELFYAHNKDSEQPERWQPLEESPKRVTKMARFFAEQAGGGRSGIPGLRIEEPVRA